MFHTSNLHQTNAADGMRAYGLSGIELGHRAQRREIAAGRDRQLRQVEAGGLVNNFRQWLGDAMVRTGSELAGQQAVAPDTAMRPEPSTP